VVRNGTTTVEFGRDATQVDVLAAAAGAMDPAAAGAEHATQDSPGEKSA
jgi:hypothetical protein